MAINSVKSKNFTLLEIQRSLNIQPQVNDQYSTLNEVYDIGNVAPPSTGFATISYLAIGRGGHQYVVGSGNSTLVTILQHNVTDAALFQQIPWIMVPVSADLSPTQRANYRLRILETISGVSYFSYYLKVIPTNTVAPTESIITLSNGSIISDVSYTPSAANLTPTPVNINNTTVNVMNGNHLVVQAVLPITLTSTDITNIINACVLKYGDISYATISEIGVVAGFDTTVSNNLGGVSATYLEVQAAQIMTFVASITELQSNPSTVTLQFSLGNSSPLPT